MNKASPSKKLYELKTSQKSESNFYLENSALTKSKDSSQILKIKLYSQNNTKSSRNFLPKQFLESEKEVSKDFTYGNHNNYIFLYYEKTIEHLKKYKKIYNNISNIKNNYNNNDDISINKKKSENVNLNINQNSESDINNYRNVNNFNYFHLNNSINKKFNYNIVKDTLYKNKKTRESKINETINDKKKLNVNLVEEIPKNNLNENEFKNLIINIDYPPFKPSHLNDKIEDVKKENKNSNIIPKTSIIPIFDPNIDNNKKNKDDEYLIEMFGKRGWICILCNNFNYETRIKCNRCGEIKKPKKITNLKLKMKKQQTDENQSDNQNKDWVCSFCKNFNYSFRSVCNRCKIPKNPQIVENYNPSNSNYIKNNNIPFSIQPFLIFNNFQNIYINRIANFMYK